MIRDSDTPSRVWSADKTMLVEYLSLKSYRDRVGTRVILRCGRRHQREDYLLPHDSCLDIPFLPSCIRQQRSCMTYSVYSSYIHDLVVCLLPFFCGAATGAKGRADRARGGPSGGGRTLSVYEGACPGAGRGAAGEDTRHRRRV